MHFHLFFLKYSLHFSQRHHDWWQSRWQSFVIDYTSKALSQPQDIFPVLQGLAKRVPGVLGDYLGGLWALTLMSNLTWYTPYS
jgi:hypothetical protein